MASICVELWPQMVQKEIESVEMERREREEFDEHFAPLSLLRPVVAFDSMSSWYSAGYGWSEPCDGRVLSVVQYRSVEWELKTVQFYIESVEMERGGTGSCSDRPLSGVDSDAHTVGYPVAKEVNGRAHEPFTPNDLVGNCDAQQVVIRQRRRDKRKLLGSEQMDCSRAGWTSGYVASTGGWRRMASNDVEWLLSNDARGR